MYYTIANFYKRFKSEADSWKGTSIMLTGGFIGFFINAVVILFYGINNKMNELEIWMGVAPPVIFTILSIIRYNKFTNYDKVKDRMMHLDKTTYNILKTLALLFMIFGLFGSIGFALYFGPTFNKSL